MKIALVYDRVNKIGGAEKIIQRLHHLWPNAPLFTAVYDQKSASWANGIHITPSFLQNVPFAKKNHEWFFWVMPYVFESFDFFEYDVVITITSAQCKGVITKPSTLHINYLLTPTKYLYSQNKLHLNKNPLGLIGKVILNYFWKHEKKWDQIAAQKPDISIAISKSIADQSQKYYHRKVDQIIYPPVDCQEFATHSSPPNLSEYYLLVSRLVPSKKIDLAVKAFNQLGIKLVIIGTGSEAKYLKKIAEPNISFLGEVDQSVLKQYYEYCQAFVFPSHEDFGIVMVEALAAGKPVIAYQKGGAKEIIEHGKHGILFDHQSVSTIMKSVLECQKHKWHQETLRARARLFDQKVFDQKFKKYVEESWQKQQKEI